MYTELRRIYSENSITLNLEQKEFGLINNIRKKITRSISRSITKDLDKKDSLARYLNDSNNLVNNKVAEDKLIDIAKKKYNTGVLKFNDSLRDTPLPNSTVNTKNLKKQIDPTGLTGRSKELAESIIENDNVIFHPENSGVEQLAHEIGHIKNRTEGLYNKAISKLSNKYPYRGNSSSIPKNFLTNKIRIQEEKNASKNAIKLLKSSKLNSDEIAKSKENLDKGIKYYKLEGNIKNKSLLNKMLNKK